MCSIEGKEGEVSKEVVYRRLVRVKVPAGKAKAGTTYSSLIAYCGMEVSDFIGKFNYLSVDIESEAEVEVPIEVQVPFKGPISFRLMPVTAVDMVSGVWVEEDVGVCCLDLYKCVYLRHLLTGASQESVTMELLGTVRSMGGFVIMEEEEEDGG